MIELNLMIFKIVLTIHSLLQIYILYMHILCYKLIFKSVD